MKVKIQDREKEQMNDNSVRWNAVKAFLAFSFRNSKLV